MECGGFTSVSWQYWLFSSLLSSECWNLSNKFFVRTAYTVSTVSDQQRRCEHVRNPFEHLLHLYPAFWKISQIFGRATISNQESILLCKKTYPTRSKILLFPAEKLTVMDFIRECEIKSLSIQRVTDDAKSHVCARVRVCVSHVPSWPHLA